MKFVLLIAAVFTFSNCYAQTAEELHSKCESNDARACALLGEMYYNGKGLPPAFTAAIKYFEKACNLNNGEVCSRLGSMYEYGRGVQWSAEKAAEYYNRACDLNYAPGCEYLARLHETGNGVKLSYEKARELLEKGCTLGDAPICSTLARVYEEGRGVAKSIEKAKEYYLKSCNLGYKDGCKEYEKIKDSSTPPESNKKILGFIELGNTTIDQFEKELKERGCNPRKRFYPVTSQAFEDWGTYGTKRAIERGLYSSVRECFKLPDCESVTVVGNDSNVIEVVEIVIHPNREIKDTWGDLYGGYIDSLTKRYGNGHLYRGGTRWYGDGFVIDLQNVEKSRFGMYGMLTYQSYTVINAEADRVEKEKQLKEDQYKKNREDLGDL